MSTRLTVKRAGNIKIRIQESLIRISLLPGESKYSNSLAPSGKESGIFFPEEE